MIITGLTITALSGLAIAAIGLMYLLAPRAAATSFGLTDIPESGSTPWLRVKGVRDATCGVVAGVLLLTAPLETIGWAVLAFALIPLGDAATVLASGGSRLAAWCIHAPTALLMIVGAALLIVGSR